MLHLQPNPVRHVLNVIVLDSHGCECKRNSSVALRAVIISLKSLILFSKVT